MVDSSFLPFFPPAQPFFELIFMSALDNESLAILNINLDIHPRKKAELFSYKKNVKKAEIDDYTSIFCDQI